MAVEKYGMIWVSPTLTLPFDVDALLGGLERDLVAYGFGSYCHYETRVLQPRQARYHGRACRRRQAPLHMRDLG